MPDVTVVNLEDLFCRPHNYGEVLYDIKPHPTENGNRMIADRLYNVLIENAMLEKCDCQYPPEVQKDYNIEQYTSLDVNLASELMEYLRGISRFRKPIGGIVVNCNPFTLGHRYLIEQSAAKVLHLFIFVVEEDKSDFPFADRIELVRQGTADIPNVTVMPSGKFIISSLTFTDYFGKSELQDRTINPSMDVKLFAKHIAPRMGINIRFAGDEPFDKITRQYNDAMRAILPQYGIDFEVIPRKEHSGAPISASRVRALLKGKDFNAIREIVPDVTYAYLIEKFSGQMNINCN